MTQKGHDWIAELLSFKMHPNFTFFRWTDSRFLAISRSKTSGCVGSSLGRFCRPVEIVKVIVRKKSNPKEFERFIDKLYSAGVEDLKIIENFDIQVGDEFDIDEDENTLSILNRYIDDSDFEYDKNIIKNIFKDLYRQACEVE